ncbi:SH3 domain-containing protein [Actinokineospora guangxiensis]|uniref:SH3 domain-containing protein n=1 Tax=Actinokineospora guangxiensis TaxID=1490288 RepID=A0ABW0EV26_9PSEU
MLVPKRALIIGGIAVVGVIYSMGVEKPGAVPASGAGACKVVVTADVLNVREKPDVASKVVGKFNQGAETVADKVVQDGFRKLAAGKWVSEEFVKPLPGHDCG